MSVRHKDRLAACEFSQTESMDFYGTYAPVAEFIYKIILLAIVFHRPSYLYRRDIFGRFLQCRLSEEVYMRQPAAYEKVNRRSHVCKLEQFLYGLEPAPGRSNQKFDTSFCKKLRMFISREANIYVRRKLSNILRPCTRTILFSRRIQ